MTTKGVMTLLQNDPMLLGRSIWSFRQLKLQNLSTIAIFLTESQLSRFEDLFKEKNFSHPNPIYRSWLQLKFASLPTETEALESVLVKHSPDNIPRCKKAAKHTEPTGAARCDPTSPEWVDILTARDAAATLTSAKKQKLNNAEASSADNLTVLTCDLCGKKYGTNAQVHPQKEGCGLSGLSYFYIC